MSGVRGVLIRSPDRHLEEKLAHRKVQAFLLHRLLRLLELSRKKLRGSEAYEERARQDEIRRPHAISSHKENARKGTNASSGTRIYVGILPQVVHVLLVSSAFTDTFGTATKKVHQPGQAPSLDLSHRKDREHLRLSLRADLRPLLLKLLRMGKPRQLFWNRKDLPRRQLWLLQV